MASSTSTKNTASRGIVLGRSAATGQYVLKPASKNGSVSLSEARSAVSGLKNGKK